LDFRQVSNFVLSFVFLEVMLGDLAELEQSLVTQILSMLGVMLPFVVVRAFVQQVLAVEVLHDVRKLLLVDFVTVFILRHKRIVHFSRMLQRNVNIVFDDVESQFDLGLLCDFCLFCFFSQTNYV
jgi:hypothetical protein